MPDDLREAAVQTRISLGLSYDKLLTQLVLTFMCPSTNLGTVSLNYWKRSNSFEIISCRG
jgi:hypothetical protein